MTIKQRSVYQVSYQQRTLQRLSQLFMLSTIVILIGGGVALLWTYQQGHQNGHAAGDVSVVGPPTLSAATVDAIFARVGSPMVGTGKLVEQTSRQANIDDAFALGVWWTETNDGEAGVGLADRNPGSVRGSVGYPSAFDGYTIYPSFTAAITYWFNMLRNDYVDGRGLSTIYAIARPYVGTTNYPLWAAKVINLMYSYRGIAPPPPVTTATLTATPSLTPTIDPAVIVANRTQQYKQHKLTQLLQSRSDSSLSLLPGQGQAQESGQQYYLDIPQVSTTTALPGPLELAIVLFGLLAALAIVLYSFKLKAGVERGIWHGQAPRGVPLSTAVILSAAKDLRSTQPEILRCAQDDRWQADLVSARFPHSQAVEVSSPSTDDLPILPTRVPVTAGSGFASQKRVTDALPRRVTLVAPQSENRTTVTVGARGGGETRSSGLLSKYRENNSNQAI